MGNVIRAAAVQFEHTAGDKAANLTIVEHFADKAAQEHVEILAFPEGCVTGYWFWRHLSWAQLTALAEPAFTGPSSQFLMQLSQKHGMTIGAGLLEKENDKLYNTYIVAMPDGTWKKHRKIHAFESDHILEGNALTVFDTPHGCRVGLLICYDNNIVENVRLTALQGAQIILAPHQTGGCRSNDPNIMGLIDAWLWAEREQNPRAIEAEFTGPKGRAWLMRWLPARAHDNGVFYIFSNGVGRDDDEIRTGNAMLIDPYGRILAETWAAKNDMVVADLDLTLIPESTGQRWIRTRRPELYAPLTCSTGREISTRALRFDEKGV